MIREFRLPDLGEGIHEGEVLAVLVAEGNPVKEGDLILEVETDKAAVEIPSPFTGIVEKILVAPGETVRVGDVLMTFSVENASRERIPAAKIPKPESAPEPESRGPAPDTRTGPVPASPATRRLARELGVDLRDVTPSGPEGLVTSQDVRAHSPRALTSETSSVTKKPEPEKPGKPAPAPVRATPAGLPRLPDFSRWGPIEKSPVRSIRKAVARQMTLSWSQIPHVANHDWVDVTRLEEFRQRQKMRMAEKNIHLTLTVFAMKAAVTALKAFPAFNCSFDASSGEIIHKHYYHIGVAVHTDDGLVVPVIRDVDRKSMITLATELDDLVLRTRQRKVSLEELQGGTFTITNAGPMGGGTFTPIINYPEVAILGLGKAQLKPVVGPDGKSIALRLMMPIVLSFDHRVADGVDAIHFMSLIMDALRDPDELFITMV
jgi:pyruvate dehydrogenase E2 component (dihydrolipoamide acetyltransferase)